MSRIVWFLLVCIVMVFSLPAFAIDGQELINQSTVMAAGGFPYKITSPGSYKLSGNLAVPANVDGIDIAANNVTLDLNGFTIQGPVTCTGGGAGIACSGSAGNGISASTVSVTILNGVVTGFLLGVYLSTGANYQVAGISAYENSVTGIFINAGLMRNNVVSFNGQSGMTCAVACVVTGNQAVDNGIEGLLTAGGLIGTNDFEYNGIAPFSAGHGSLISQKQQQL